MKKISIALDVFTVDEEGYHIKLPAYINGLKGNFILDTGASRSVISLEFSELLQLKDLMEMNTSKASGIGNNEILNYLTEVDITIGKLQVPQHQVTIMDLSHVNQAYQSLGLPSIQGIIGSDILVKHHATISLKKKRMYLTDFRNS